MVSLPAFFNTIPERSRGNSFSRFSPSLYPQWDSWFLSVCPHILGLNIHLQWPYIRCAGKHQLWTPICSTKAFRPLNEMERKATAGTEIEVIVCFSMAVWFRAACMFFFISVSFLRYIRSLDPAASWIPQYYLIHIPSVSFSFILLCRSLITCIEIKSQQTGSRLCSVYYTCLLCMLQRHSLHNKLPRSKQSCTLACKW